MSKGSKRRPMDERYCTPDQFRENYDRAFAADAEPVAEAVDDVSDQPRKEGQEK